MSAVTIDVSELQYAQGDVMLAVQTIVRLKLPLTTAGADACESDMREHGGGNTTYWKHDGYLRTAIHLAQECVREARNGYRK
jgi:hypothetical protein